MKPTQPIRDILTDESKWTQHVAARAASGLSVASRNPEAVCWCLSGALSRLGWPMDLDRAVYVALAERGEVSIVEFNDDPATTFADVLALLDDMDEVRP